MSDRKARHKSGYVDEYVGRDLGRNTASSSSYRESSRREAPEIPRSESNRPDVPRRTSTASTQHSVGSSRHSNRERSRRDSDAFSTRPPVETEYSDRSQPIAIDRDSSKRYHDTRGYSRSRDESTFDPRDSYDNAESSNARRGSHSTYDPPPSRERDVRTSPDQLSGSLAKLTMNEVVGSPSFVTTSHHGISGDYEKHDRSQPPFSSPRNVDEAFPASSHRDKGKNVVREPSPGPALDGIPKHVISGTRGDTEELDKSYAKRSHDYKKFFRPGRVFTTLWTESYDDSMQSENDQFQSIITYQVAHKQKVVSKIRRFVVVKQGDRSCTCLPVTTYNGRGYKKNGINLDDHGLIYSSRDPPSHIKGINKEPLRIILSKGADKLRNPSYLNYGRVYTIETNVKVKDVGDLDTESKRLLRAYYMKVCLRDFPDHDNYAPPGPTSNPQQRDVEVAGAGAAFVSTGSQQQYDSRDQYDRPAPGGYNQLPRWNTAGVLPPPTNSLYPAGPTYQQPPPSVSSHIPTYEYANVQNFEASRRSTGYESDSGYNQGITAGAGFANQQLTAQPQIYPQTRDPRWSDQTPHPQYQTTPAPGFSSNYYGGRDQGYNDPSSSRYPPSGQNYGQSQGIYQGAGWTPTLPGRQVIYEEDLTLPTFEQAQSFEESQALQRQRRESSSGYSTSGRGRYDDPNNRYRSSGSGHYGS